MSLYAIGDLHLHFQSELKAPGQLKERVWKNHEEKFLKNCSKMIKQDDTLVLVGDHSWGKNLQQCEQDLEYISSLPGKKVLIRGNHDMFWDANKTQKLNDMYNPRLFFLQDSVETYRDYALVGTKGFTFEGPFYLDRYGRIADWDVEAQEHARKLVERETVRLRKSFELAKAAGYSKFIMFLHYPPTNILEHLRAEGSAFTEMAKEYGAQQVIYAHCHGISRFHDSIEGDFEGIRYQLVSGDYLKWKPYKVLD